MCHLSRRGGLAVAAALLLPLPALGQGLACPEIQVNTFTTGSQVEPAVAVVSGGDFVVVWGHFGVGQGVRSRRFGSGGAPLGPEFQVSALTTGQNYPDIGAAVDGSFVVAWESRYPSLNETDVRARRFDAAGVPEAAEFVVNSFTVGYQGGPSLAMLGPPGEFVVAWTAYPAAGSLDIFARRFGPAGPLGPEFQVNTFTTNIQQEVDVAASPNGGFLVTWMSLNQDGDSGGIYARRYDAGGAPTGPEFLVNTYTPTHQRGPRAAFDATGNLVVVWRSFRDGGTSGIFARLFDPAGQPRGAEFQVNTYTPGDQINADVAFDSSGSFQVLWVGPEPDGAPLDDGLFARRFAPNGTPEGPEFRLNASPSGDRAGPALAALGNRGFVTSWFGGNDGDQHGIFASVDCARLYTVAPCRLVDTRLPPGPAGGPRLEANNVRTFAVTGLCGVPADARAVAVVVTAVNPTDTGFVSVVPLRLADFFPPLTSTVNFIPGRTRAGNAVASLGIGGQVNVWCGMPVGSTGGTHFALDVYGYFKR